MKRSGIALLVLVAVATCGVVARAAVASAPATPSAGALARMGLRVSWPVQPGEQLKPRAELTVRVRADARAPRLALVLVRTTASGRLTSVVKRATVGAGSVSFILPAASGAHYRLQLRAGRVRSATAFSTLPAPSPTAAPTIDPLPPVPTPVTWCPGIPSLAPATAPAASSELEGIVWSSPGGPPPLTCPSTTPIAATVTVTDHTSHAVVATQTVAAGTGFEIAVAPGQYDLTATLPTGPTDCWAPANPITVSAVTATTANVVCGLDIA